MLATKHAVVAATRCQYQVVWVSEFPCLGLGGVIIPTHYQKGPGTRHTHPLPCGQNDWETPVKHYLPATTVAGGKITHRRSLIIIIIIIIYFSLSYIRNGIIWEHTTIAMPSYRFWFYVTTWSLRRGTLVKPITLADVGRVLGTRALSSQSEKLWVLHCIITLFMNQSELSAFPAGCTYLSIKRKLVQFHSLHEHRLDPSFLLNRGPAGLIDVDRPPHVLLGFSQYIVHVNLRVPELVPFNVIRVLKEYRHMLLNIESKRY